MTTSTTQPPTSRPQILGGRPEALAEAAHLFVIGDVQVTCRWIDGCWQYAYEGESILRSAATLQDMINACSVGF